MVSRVFFFACFLLLVGLLPAAVTPVHAQAQNQQLLVPDPGVVSYTFRNQFRQDVPGTLDLIKGMGITNIEFSNLFGQTAPALRAMLDERGLICTSLGVSYNALENNMDQVIADARALGARYVRIGSFPYEAPFTIEDARRAVTAFNTVGKTLKENGLSFAYHNHGYEFQPYGDGTYFDYIVQNTNPEYVSFEMDVFWVIHPGADPVAYLQKYPDRFRLMHLKDMQKGITGDFSGRAPSEYDVQLGTGQVDWPALLRVAQDSSIEYFYIEDESDDVVNRVPRSRAYIMSLTK